MMTTSQGGRVGRRRFRAALGVHPIALSTHRFGSAVLICSVTAFVLVASALAAVAATAAPAALLSSSIGRSSDRPEHAPLRLSSPSSLPVVLLACWRHQLRPLLRRQPLRRRCFRAALGVHSIALSTLHFGSAVLICSVAAFVLAASALTAVALIGRSGGAASEQHWAFIRSL